MWISHYFKLAVSQLTTVCLCHLLQISEIIGRFERKGYKLVAIKLVIPTKEFAAQHYDDLKARPFFNSLCNFLSSGPVVAMVSVPGPHLFGMQISWSARRVEYSFLRFLKLKTVQTGYVEDNENNWNLWTPWNLEYWEEMSPSDSLFP